MLFTVALLLSLKVAAASEFKLLEGHKVREDYGLPLPYTYVSEKDLPKEFDWGDVNGTSYLTHSLNQHIPQYCGSCWAHGALSALADRIKIARKAKGEDINLSIQYILNCAHGIAGSCHGGSHTGVYEFVKKKGFVPYDTCMPYLACSSESSEGFCKHVDTTCSSTNTCKTCNTFSNNGGKCAEIDVFPNATIAEYGTYGLFSFFNKVHKIKAEIYARGPVAAGINAEPILDYKGGVVKDGNMFHKLVNHVVSITGWGVDKDGTEYWNIRNSWGEYWGELGFVRVETGKNALGIESEVAWATPGKFTIRNFPCDENGDNCGAGAHFYVDPSNDKEAVQRRLRGQN